MHARSCIRMCLYIYIHKLAKSTTSPTAISDFFLFENPKTKLMTITLVERRFRPQSDASVALASRPWGTNEAASANGQKTRPNRWGGPIRDHTTPMAPKDVSEVTNRWLIYLNLLFGCAANPNKGNNESDVYDRCRRKSRRQKFFDGTFLTGMFQLMFMFSPRCYAAYSSYRRLQ